MSNHPQAGDGIVTISGDRWVVDGIETNSTTGAFEAVLTTNKYGRRLTFYPNEYRRETFAEFLTRPTGFGRTSWPSFITIQAFVAALLIAGFLTWADGGWIAAAFGLLIEGVLVWQTWWNYTGRNR